MKLLSPLPEALIELLRSRGIQQQDVILSIKTDINLLGHYEPQWLVATHKEVCVIDPKRPEDSFFTIDHSEAGEYRAVAVVGSGLLQIKVQGIWLDLVRYSNSMKYFFARVAKRLEQNRKGENFTLDEDDDLDPRRCSVSGIVLEFPGQVSPFAIKKSAAISRVVQLMWRYWPQASVMMGLLVVGVSLDMIAPRLVQYLIDYVLSPKGRNAEQPIAFLGEIQNPLNLLLLVVVVYALVQIVRAIITAVNGRLASRVATNITFDMRGKLLSHLENLSLSFYDKQSVGSLVGRVAYDTEAVQGFMTQLTAGFLMQILMVILAALSMFSLEPRLAVWTLLPAPFVLAGTFFFYRYVYPRYEFFWDRSSKQAGMLNGLLSGIRVVKAFAQEPRELERFQKSSLILREARRSVDAAAATFYPMMGLVFGVGGWIVWYVGGKEVMQNELTLGTLIAFFSYLGLFYGPLGNLTNLTTWLTQFTTQVHRIFEVLDTPVSVPEPDQPVPLGNVKGKIEFQNVVFGYSRQTPVLKNVSFTIDAGQAIGVVGRSGSGKTTLINLISRFYDVDDGKILIDDQEIRDIGKLDLRRNVGVVLQEPFLFRGTLWENLIYGRHDSSVQEVIAASRAGNAHDFIMKQMQAYDTWVGERGSGLSGGERQRLSIARALLCDPSILILDEATSSVDSESELAIQNALSQLIKGRTSIIIAHRLSTLRNCDRILVMDEGKLIEQGNHQELMDLNGKYARLVRIQGTGSTSNLDLLAAQDEINKTQGGSLPATTEEDTGAGLTPINGHRPRWLTPELAAIHLGSRNALHVTVLNERIYNGVFALQCRPVQAPDQYISLRWINADNREQEIGLIRDLAQWPEEARTLVNQSLTRRYLIHTVTLIKSIRLEHEYLRFDVETNLGSRQFIMRRSQETAHDYGEKGKVLVDVDENRYVIPDADLLPMPGRARFQRFIYW